MLLDYNAAKNLYFLRVPRSEGVDVKELMTSYGFDLSIPASTPSEAILFSPEPYAAVSFAEIATPEAYASFEGIIGAVAASRLDRADGHFRVPSDKELWPFQKASLRYALARQHALIADEPGLGKTPIAITYANEIQARRVLVICPANIRQQWQRKVYEWATNPWPYHVHVILNGKHGVHPTAAWTVVSYDLARTPTINAALMKLDWDLMILDEAHYVKTSNSERTRAILGHSGEAGSLADKAKRIVALTGTPIPNRPREAYVLSRALCWDAIDFMGAEAFNSRFNPRVKGEKFDERTGKTRVFVDERSGRHAELQNRLRGNFMTRHLKREVMTQLRLPVYDLVLLEETAAVRAALAAEKMLDIDPENLAGADIKVLGHIAAVRKQMGVALAPQIADYAVMLLEGGEDKLVLFGWHIEVLDIWMERLARYSPVRIDGSTSQPMREKNVATFRKEAKCRVIVGNLQSMGIGVDGLQDVCAHGLLGEPSWVNADNIQAFDRLDRGGQTRTVQCDILVAPGSISEKVLAAALRKGQVTHAALDKRFEI